MVYGIHFLRITVETKTPMSIGSDEVVSRTIGIRDEKGKKSEVRTSGIARDANGLPVIPGSSAQGVLRQMIFSTQGSDAANEYFGFEDVFGNGQASQITVNWGIVHDSHNEAITGLKDMRGVNDPFLNLLSSDWPLWRDHNALNERHSVDGHKKFARIAVPVGTRFSIELTAWGDEEERRKLIEAARMLRHPRFRLGGAGGRGYGRIKVVAASYKQSDLSNPRALRELRRQPPSQVLKENILELDEFSAPPTDVTEVVISLNFSDSVRFGAGEGQSDEGPQNDNTLGALREIKLDAQGGKILEHYPMTGSAFKGPLVHRMAFYANKVSGRTIDVNAFLELEPALRKKKISELSGRPDLLNEFLGTKKMKGSGSIPGSASRLDVEDTYLTLVSEPQIVNHASIDHFTAGTMDLTGALFAEEWLVGPTANIMLTIRDPKELEEDGVGGWNQHVANSFLLALRDICMERLPIGARSLGVCSGYLSWRGTRANEWEKAAKVMGIPVDGGDML